MLMVLGFIFTDQGTDVSAGEFFLILLVFIAQGVAFFVKYCLLPLAVATIIALYYRDKEKKVSMQQHKKAKAHMPIRRGHWIMISSVCVLLITNADIDVKGDVRFMLFPLFGVILGYFDLLQGYLKIKKRPEKMLVLYRMHRHISIIGVLYIGFRLLAKGASSSISEFLISDIIICILTIFAMIASEQFLKASQTKKKN